MRVISQYRAYEGLTLQDEISEVLAGGHVRIVQPKHWLGPFTHGDITEWERKTAVDHWTSPRGLTDGENFLWRLSSCDTDELAKRQGWTDAQKAEYEERIRNHPENGNDFLVIDRPRVPAPYAKYDQHRKTVGKRTLDHALQDIKSAYESSGFDLDQAVLYEQENLNDDKVVEFLRGLNADAPAEELVQA